MPRKPRKTSASGVYHFVTRGVNKKKLFHKDDDYRAYLLLVKEYADRFDVQTYHYCLMTNHIHLVLKSPDLEMLGKFAHFVQRRYAYYYCKTHRWSEQVFKRNYSSFPIESDAYLLECGRYVERNPLTAKLVGSPEEHRLRKKG